VRLTAGQDSERAGLGGCPCTVTKIKEDTNPYNSCQWSELGVSTISQTCRYINDPSKTRNIHWLEGNESSSTGLALGQYAGEDHSIQYKD
jgi:hypothetical protein